MPLDHEAHAPRSPVQMSRVTNGSQKLMWGDGRSRAARRYRDLITSFASEFGGFETLGPLSQQLVRSLASVSVELEAMECARVAGEVIDPIRFVRAVNVQRRLLRDLRKANAPAPGKRPTRPKPPPVGPTFAEVAAQIVAARPKVDAS